MKNTNRSAALDMLEKMRLTRCRLQLLRQRCEAKAAFAGPPDVSGDGMEKEIRRLTQSLADDKRRLHRAIMRMDNPGEQMLAEMVFLYDFEPKQIMASLGVSKSSYYGRFQRALASLERALGEEGANACAVRSVVTDEIVY